MNFFIIAMKIFFLSKNALLSWFINLVIGYIIPQGDSTDSCDSSDSLTPLNS